MGAEFCRRLDQKGLDSIWMISRRQDLMEDVAEDLKTPCRIISADLTDRIQLDSIRQVLESESPDIQYLVNCAGFGAFGMSWKIPKERTRSMIDLNVTALVEITNMCVPHMVRGGHIIELCSESAYIEMYDLNVYASTKAFVKHYCGGLRKELSCRSISVTEVSPGWVRTDFIDIAKADGKIPEKVFKGIVEKEDIVREALIAADKGKKRSICGASNRLIASISTHFPGTAANAWKRRFD